MTNAFQVVFHNIEQSQALIDQVSKRIKKLERYCDQILAGRVVLDSPHNNHHKGRVYSVGLEIHTPIKEIRVNQEQHDNHAHENLYIAIRDTFNIAERQLKKMSSKRGMSATVSRERKELVIELLVENDEENTEAA